jgi:hypothetical protein
VNQHAPAVDVCDLQMPEFRIPHPRRVQDHQHRAMREAVRRVDQLRDVIDAENLREATRGLGVRRVVQRVPALQRLHEEEADRADVEPHRPRRQLPLTEQMRLIRAQVRRCQSVRRSSEEPGKLFDVLNVVRDRGRGIVATMEFLQHRLSEMGHKTPPVTHTLPGRSAEAYA